MSQDPTLPAGNADADANQSAELVLRAQGGDAGAVNELLARYLRRARRVIEVKIPSWQRPWIDPDDVLQETLLVAARKLAELEVRTPSSILQWLAKIADFEIKNRLEYLRAEKRNPERERRLRVDDDPSASQSGVVVAARGPTASEFYERCELEAEVDRALRDLEPGEYREVILLRDYCEAEWEHIGLQLGKPVGAAQDLYHRAHKRLREKLARLAR